MQEIQSTLLSGPNIPTGRYQKVKIMINNKASRYRGIRTTPYSEKNTHAIAKLCTTIHNTLRQPRYNASLGRSPGSPSRYCQPHSHRTVSITRLLTRA